MTVFLMEQLMRLVFIPLHYQQKKFKTFIQQATKQFEKFRNIFQFC